MKKKKIVFAGMGYVGQAMRKLFEARSDIYDIKWWTPTSRDFTREECAKADLCVICVPTPMNEDDGHCDTTAVESVFEWCDAKVYLCKSTVPPGTTDALMKKHRKKIVFSPEYVGEGKYYVAPWIHPHPTDVIHHTFQIFGGKKKHCAQVVDFFTPIMGPNKTYAITDARTAEMVKYIENVWGAMKVSWANEMYDCCKAMGVEWVEVRELWALDSRVEKMHTAVFPAKRGWGGKCYPKDVTAFIRFCRNNGFNPAIMEQVCKSNAELTNDELAKKIPEALEK